MFKWKHLQRTGLSFVYFCEVGVFSSYFGVLLRYKEMTRFNLILFVLWTVVAFGLCQEDDDSVEEIADKDVVKGVVEVCQPRHQ